MFFIFNVSDSSNKGKTIVLTNSTGSGDNQYIYVFDSYVTLSGTTLTLNYMSDGSYTSEIYEYYAFI